MKTNDGYATFSKPGEIRFRRILPGPLERVWEYLTDPEKRARWFAGGPMELRPGGRVELHIRHKNLGPDETPPEEHQASHDANRVMTGTVTRCEPPRVLAFTFDHYGKPEATFELASQGRNVVLILTHRGTNGDPAITLGFAYGWHVHLTHLIARLDGSPRPPFWPAMQRFKTEYAQLLRA